MRVDLELPMFFCINLEILFQFFIAYALHVESVKFNLFIVLCFIYRVSIPLRVCY